jgi:hypothetical protein
MHQFIHVCVCCHWLCYRKKRVKIYNIIGEIKPLLCKSCYSFFQKHKTPKTLFSKKIKLNDPIQFVKTITELEEGKPILGWY